MNLHVHYHNPPEADSLENLRGKLHSNLQLTSGPDPPDQPQYQILIAGHPTRELLEASSNLTDLIIPWAGVPESTRELLKDFPDIRVHNLHYNAAATAEMAIALFLAAAKQILPFDQQLRRHDWSGRYEPNPALLVEGKSALILGYGEVGQRVVRACLGMGMEVVALSRSGDDAAHIPSVDVFTLKALPDMLPRADVVFVCLPDTPETRGLIGEQELRAMSSQATLVNVARGPIVVEEALYQALKDAHIFAAGIDVWYQYPQGEDQRPHTAPSKFPFHELNNLVMSPHRAGGWRGEDEARLIDLAQLLNSAARGEEMGNRVQIEIGY
jgi:phosphoglycerate dehydrogenase-like enzyme